MRLATLVRAQLAAELALYVAGGTALAGRGVQPLALVALAVSAALGARLVLVVASTTISHLNRSARPAESRIGPAGIAALVAREWLAMLRDNFWCLPFDAVAMRPDPAPARAAATPVLMVHGYLSNRGLLQPLVDALERCGATQVFTLNFRHAFDPIEAQAEELDRRVIALLEATGRERLVLVCHSMGGLVARAWLARHGARRVERLVTIASPHHGTVLATLGVGRNARQMRPGSDFLRALEAAEGDRGPPCAATSIYSVHDNLVAPQDTSRLAWARNVGLRGWGHVEIVQAAPVALLVAEELRGAGALAAR